MAQAIRTIVQTEKSPEDVRRIAAEELQTAVSNNSEALIQMIRLLQQLHDKEFLGMASALLEQGTGILEIIVSQANRPEYATGLKNALGLVSLLGQLDVSMLSGMVSAASIAKQKVEHGEAQSVGGVFKLLGILRDEDVKVGLGFMVELLKALGSQLRERGPSHD